MKKSKVMQKLVEYSAFIAIVNRLRNNGNISEKEMFLFHHMSNLD